MIGGVGGVKVGYDLREEVIWGGVIQRCQQKVENCSVVTLPTVGLVTAVTGPCSPPLARVSHVCTSKTFANVLDVL